MTELQSTDELLEELFGDPKAAAATARARLAAPPAPHPEEVRLQLDPQVLEAFRAAGGDWQQRINRALSTWLAENDPAHMHSA